MHRKIANVLFVSDENQCRSLLAEACLNHLGQGQFKAFSCGVPDRISEAPFGWTLLALQTADIPAGNLRCKSWMEFMRSGAPKMDFVVALDQDTLQLHPPWPGQPATALWNYPHVEAGGASRHKVGTSAVQTLLSLRRRIELLICLHARGKSRADLQHDLQDLAHV